MIFAVTIKTQHEQHHTLEESPASPLSGGTGRTLAATVQAPLHPLPCHAATRAGRRKLVRRRGWWWRGSFPLPILLDLDRVSWAAAVARAPGARRLAARFPMVGSGGLQPGAAPMARPVVGSLRRGTGRRGPAAVGGVLPYASRANVSRLRHRGCDGGGPWQ